MANLNWPLSATIFRCGALLSWCCCHYSQLWCETIFFRTMAVVVCGCGRRHRAQHTHTQTLAFEILIFIHLELEYVIFARDFHTRTHTQTHPEMMAFIFATHLYPFLVARVTCICIPFSIPPMYGKRHFTFGMHQSWQKFKFHFD